MALNRPVDGPTTYPSDIDGLPANYRPRIKKPQSREDFAAVNVTPRSATCRDVENARKLISWLIGVAHDLGYTDVVSDLIDLRQRLVSANAGCYAVD